MISIENSEKFDVIMYNKTTSIILPLFNLSSYMKKLSYEKIFQL